MVKVNVVVYGGMGNRDGRGRSEMLYQDVKAGWFEEGDLVSNGEGGEAWQAFGELDDLDDAFGGELAEFVPQPQIQLYPVVWARVLEKERNGEKKQERTEMSSESINSIALSWFFSWFLWWPMPLQHNPLHIVLQACKPNSIYDVDFEGKKHSQQFIVWWFNTQRDWKTVVSVLS